MKIEMKCEFCFDNNCLDLPSLTKIQGSNSWNIHYFMGHVILESMIWFDLIWFDKLDIPNLTENNIYYGVSSFSYTADLQATSTFHFISFKFSHFRCSCSRKVHSKDVGLFEKLEKTTFLSFTGIISCLVISCLDIPFSSIPRIHTLFINLIL